MALTHKQRKFAYLKEYEAQENIHFRYRWLYRALTITSAFVPPISLLFTIPQAIFDWNKEKYKFLSISIAVICAFVPIISAFASWNITYEFEDRRRRKDLIQMNDDSTAYYNSLQSSLSYYRKEFNLPNENNEEVIIHPTQDSKQQKAYFDLPRAKRNSMLIKCNLHQLHIKQLTKEDITLEEAVKEAAVKYPKVADVHNFFKRKFAESAQIDLDLERKYFPSN